MPAFAPFTINDREATPVAHTFNPRSKNGNVAEYVESDGVLIGDNVFTVSSRLNGNYMIATVKLTAPITVVTTVNGVAHEEVDRVHRVAVEFKFPNASTTQERDNVIGLMANALASSVTPINGVILNGEGTY